MKLVNIKVLKIFLPLLFGIFLVWYSLKQMSIDELFAYFNQANHSWVLFGTFLGLLSHLSRAYRWQFQLDPLGYKIKLENSIMAVFAAYLINYTIPRAGEIARATILKNYEDVPFEKGFGTIVAERIADLIVVSCIILVTLFLNFDFIFGFLKEKFSLFKIIAGLVFLLAFLVFFLVFIKRSSSRLAVKIKVFVVGLGEGVLSIFKMKKKWAFIFHTLFIWTMYVLMFYVTTFSLDETQNISFTAILIAFIASSFSIAATNGGIGSFPESIVLAFALFNIPEDPSRALGWIMWSSQTILVIIIGGLSLIYLPIFNRAK